MTKSELIEKIAAKNPNLTLKDIAKIVDVVFDSIIESMANGDRVEFRGFGSFCVHERERRTAKNPRTGEKLLVDARKIPHFKAGKQLYDMLNK
ncbi:MAG: integration host factor subunit beta [Alphaproteobacteria bacterium]|nr:integration host factor subunit beta [Alphaproteobacteria bacterium]